MSEKFSLKDHLFNEPKVSGLAYDISKVYPSFRKEEFVNEVISSFPNLELKQRITWISTCLRSYLPPNYQDAVTILLQALPLALDESKNDNDFGDFIHAPFSEFIAEYGCTAEKLDFSLEAIKEITKRFSAEYAIRKFINHFPNQTIETIKVWSKDSNYHVRRLCSEGTRAKLPWGQKITIDPTSTISILDNLYHDHTRFVTRSVANHLNDLSKTHPELIFSTLERWLRSNKQAPEEMQFITKHTLRNLVKDGHPKAMNLLGFSDATDLSISNLIYPTLVQVGASLDFSFTIASNTSKKAVIDYIVFFQNKLGQMNSKKVHKLQTVDLMDDQHLTISKKHPFRANMTTRQLYPGIHRIELQVNGEVLAGFEFEMVVS